MEEMQRPRRILGDIIRAAFCCPLCREEDELRVVAYRRRAARIQCRACELRFSVNLMDAIHRVSAGRARHPAPTDVARFAWSLLDEPDA